MKKLIPLTMLLAAMMTSANGQEKMKEMKGTTDPYEQARMRLGPLATTPAAMPPRTVRYDLYVADTLVNYSGKNKRAIAVNGSIPMPVLIFTEGDTAEIVVHNNLKEPTALHWHGLFLPNQFDGVPYLTQNPIAPGETYTYRFPIIQHGTHWYHSHYKFQEQIGMYGAFIMKKREEWAIPTIPLVLSEWSDLSPKQIDRGLHEATDWFAIRKGELQSYLEAIKTGNFKVKMANEWKRMNAMDVSDVFYDKFLINGSERSVRPEFRAGDKVRLRIANGGSSSYFWLKFAGGKMTVVASDGNDVEPVEVDRLIIGVSEVYDVVVTIPENKSYEFLATAEDRSGSASLWLGSGEQVSAGKLPKLDYFAGMKMMNEMMGLNGNMKPMPGMKMQNQAMDMNAVMYPEITGKKEKGKAKEDRMAAAKAMDMPGMDRSKMDMSGMSMSGMNMDGMNMPGDGKMVTLNYNMLRSPKKTTLPDGGTWRELRFTLTGNMNRYVWTMDNRTVSESDKILIKKGENLRIVLYNNSMMRHPMHLHGHDFRILNGQGDHAPLKNVLDIMPMEQDTIEFNASEKDGDWFFHCHILYHMMSGMGRIFSYEGPPADTGIPDREKAMRKLYWDDRMPHLMGNIGLSNTGTGGMVMLANKRWALNTMWDLGRNVMMGYESLITFGRYIGETQWLFPYVGFDYHYRRPGPDDRNIFGNEYRNLFGQVNDQDDRHTFVAGLAYTLPMLVVADARVDGNGKFRFQLNREEIPLTARLRMGFRINTDKEYAAGFGYIVTRLFRFTAEYDSDMGLGGGIALNY